jgi:hypothetical protein
MGDIMKVKNVFYATSKDGQIQKFNAYPRYSTGKYATRFYVKTKSGDNQNWFTGKLCTFEKQEDAIAFGYKIASSVKKANDLTSLKKLVEINAAYKKAFE